MRMIIAALIVAVVGVFAGLVVAEAASSPALFTFRIDHQTMCRLESREFPISIGNPTDEPMTVRADTVSSASQPVIDGGGFVSLDETLFVMPPHGGKVVTATLAISRTARPKEYATLLRFTNMTGDVVQAAVGVWLRFDVEPWRIGSPRCER